MFGYKVKIEDDLYEKLKQCVENAGYASVDEFVIHTLEKEVKTRLSPQQDDAASREEVTKRLQGLGYID